MKGQIRVL